VPHCTVVDCESSCVHYGHKVLVMNIMLRSLLVTCRLGYMTHAPLMPGTEVCIAIAAAAAAVY